MTPKSLGLFNQDFGKNRFTRFKMAVILNMKKIFFNAKLVLKTNHNKQKKVSIRIFLHLVNLYTSSNNIAANKIIVICL